MVMRCPTKAPKIIRTNFAATFIVHSLHKYLEHKNNYLYMFIRAVSYHLSKPIF